MYTGSHARSVVCVYVCVCGLQARNLTCAPVRHIATQVAWSVCMCVCGLQARNLTCAPVRHIATQAAWSVCMCVCGLQAANLTCAPVRHIATQVAWSVCMCMCGGRRRETSRVRRVPQGVLDVVVAQHAPAHPLRRETTRVSDLRQTIHRILQPLLPPHDAQKGRLHPPPLLLLLQPFNGLFCRTTWVSRYQTGKTSLYLNEARDYGGLECSAFSALNCWLGGRKGIRPVKKLSGEVLAWLSVWSKVHWCRLAYGPDEDTATHRLLLQ